MPPEKVTLKDRVQQYEDEGMAENNGGMLCTYCNKRVEWAKKDTVKKHVNGDGHKEKKEKAKAKKREHQPTLEETMNSSKKRKEEKHQFILDTVEAFLSANIPVLKLDNPEIRKWLDKYVKGSGDLPVSKVLRDVYIPEVAKIHEEKIKTELKDKDIVVYSDETTDGGGRCVYNIMFQTVDPAAEQKLYLAASTVLDAANSSNCANAVLDSLKRYEKNLEEVAAFNADSARYMTKCFKILQSLNEDLLHIQCWPHKLHHVGNTFQESLPELNLAVKHVKKIFLNARKRKNEYLVFLKDKYPDNKSKWKGFPSPIITRWNSWKKAVNYLNEFFDDILEFLEEESENDDHNFEEEDDEETGRIGGSVGWLKTLTSQQKQKIKVYAEFVAVKSKGVEITIKQLQSKKKPTGHVIYQKLDAIERKFALIMSENCGWLEDLPYLDSLPRNKQTEYITTLQAAAKAARAALVKYSKSDPARKLFLSLEALLSPRSLGRSQLPPSMIKDHMKNIPFVKKLSCEEFMTGQAALMQMVREETNKPDFKSINVVSLLCALKNGHLSFSNACLKALWLLPANANSERSISTYNIVVDDRRRKLKPENSERLTIVYFNMNEYNYRERGSADQEVEESQEELLTLNLGFGLEQNTDPDDL